MIGFANLRGSSGFQLLSVVLAGGDFMKTLLEKWLYITSRILPVGLNSFFFCFILKTSKFITTIDEGPDPASF